MLNNCSILTYYHKTLDNNRLEKWNRYQFNDVWEFGAIGSKIYNGYTKSDKIDVRIPLSKVKDKKIFALGDIICIDDSEDISTQSDLDGKEFYNVTSIKVNDFGSMPHIHLGGQ